MAKQKVKLPLKRVTPRVATDAVPTPVPVPAKRKAKNPRKLKAKAAGASAPAVVDGSFVAKRPVKAKGKPQRRGDLAPGPMAEGAVTRLDALIPPLAPLVVRPRKIRIGAPLGRLERLEVAIGEVRIGGRASPRTRKLLAAGVPKMAQKVIEEAAEAAIEAIRGDHAAFVNESVDLFYNLLALCSEIGVPLSAIWAEMDRREQTLGMAEKLPKSPDP